MVCGTPVNQLAARRVCLQPTPSPTTPCSSTPQGPGSQSRRTSTLRGLITACRGPEVKFLTRTVIANLRVGANWRSVIGPLAMAATLHRVQRQALLTQQGGLDHGTLEQAKAEEQREEGQEAGAGAGNGQQHAAACTGGADAGSAAAAATAAQPSVGGKGNDSGALKGAVGAMAKGKEQGSGHGSSRAGGRRLQGVGKEELSAAAAAAAEAFHISPSFDVLVPALLEVGAHSLAQRWAKQLGGWTRAWVFSTGQHCRAMDPC